VKTIFQATYGLDVADRGYVDGPKGRPISKAALDAEVSTAPLFFTLEYPFGEKFHGVVEIGEREPRITLRMIIRDVRRGFREMYRGSKAASIPGMRNKRVVGRYGEAFHVIGDLVIERIRLHGTRLHVDIGS
jgi:hypothetical protein